MTTHTPSRTRRNPDGMFAGPGAVNQHDGKVPLYICNACGADVVWLTSQRTGRKYLANVSHGHHQQRFYIGASLHKCVWRAGGREASVPPAHGTGTFTVTDEDLER